MRSRKTLGIAVALIVLALLPVLGLPLYFTSFLIGLFTFLALAEAWTILGGFAGYVSFGHVAFFGIGGYTSAVLLLNLGISPFIGFLFGGGTAALFAAAIGRLIVRLQGPYFSITTLLIALIVALIVRNTPALGGTTGLWLPFPEVSIEVNRALFYWLMLALALATTGVAAWVENSKLGFGLVALRQNEQVAEAAGIDTTSLKLRTLIISAALTGAVGGAYAYLRSYFSPDIAFDLNITVTLFLMALFGGCRTWKGPVIGAVLLWVIAEILTVTVGDEVARIVYGLSLVAVVVFLPDGLIGLLSRGNGSAQASKPEIASPSAQSG